MAALGTIPPEIASNFDRLRVKELEEQQRSLVRSVVCGFNQLLDLRDLNTGIHSTRLAELPACPIIERLNCLTTC